MKALTTTIFKALPAFIPRPPAAATELIQEKLVGNTNTKKFHKPNCNAIKMMKPEHKVLTEDGEGFSPCGWCHGRKSEIESQLRFGSQVI